MQQGTGGTSLCPPPHLPQFTDPGQKLHSLPSQTVMWEMLLKACESQKWVTETSRGSIPPTLEGSCWPSMSTDDPSVSPSLMHDSVISAHSVQAPGNR